MKRKRLSIIICTFNRKDFLSHLLSSLYPQIVDKQEVEVLIIDNNSTDNTRVFTQNWIEKHQNIVTYFLEPSQGLSYARNKGYIESKGDWIAYLDDDAYPGDNWVDQVSQNISKGEFDAFGGAYLPWYRDGKVDWYLDDYGSNTSWLKYSKPTQLNRQFFSGGNAVYSRKVLDATQGFPNHLGMNGATTAYGEEDYVQHIARRKGFRTGYDPSLIIYHYVSPNKQTLEWFITKGRAKGRDYWLQPDTTTTFSKLLFFTLLLPISLVKSATLLCIRAFKKDYSIMNFKVEMAQKFQFHWSRLRYGFKDAFKKKH